MHYFEARITLAAIHNDPAVKITTSKVRISLRSLLGGRRHRHRQSVTEALHASIVEHAIAFVRDLLRLPKHARVLETLRTRATEEGFAAKRGTSLRVAVGALARAASVF